MRNRSGFVCAWMLAVAFACGAGIPTKTTAALISGSFEGAIIGGQDIHGYFGVPGGDLTGQMLSGSLTYDTTLAPSPTSPGTYISSGMGGWLTADITINGRTWAFDNWVGDPLTQSDLSVTLTDEPDSFSVSLARTLVATVMSSQLFTFSLLEESGDFVDGLALPESMLWVSSGLFPFSGFFSVNAACSDPLACDPQLFEGSFLLSSLRIQATSVPEPPLASLLGIGLAGIWIRRRRRADRAPGRSGASQV